VQVERTRQLDDQAVLDALHAGAPEALHEIWQRYGDVVYWAAMALTADTDEAVAAVADAFVVLGRTPAAARREPLVQYLVGAVRRRCSDRSVLGHLTDQQLTAVALVRSQERGATEVASVLDVPRPTACALLGEALRTLAPPRIGL
jgi:DNA-directed RNA polymerase specialized sigma24 family protein